MERKVDLESPLIGITKEVIKAPASSSSTRREYLRMKRESELRKRAETRISEERKPSINDMITTIPEEEEPAITSFPLPQTDCVDGPPSLKREKSETHLEAREQLGHSHGARMCMISAVIHMKCLAIRKAKSVNQLKKIPLTTQQEISLRQKKHTHGNDDSDSETEEPLDYLKKCRYLRGVKEDSELTIEDIFS